MKKCSLLLLSFLLLLSVVLLSNIYHASASTFPNDAKNITLDAHAGTTGTLLASSTNYRTILYASISTQATDGHICISPESSCSGNPAIPKLIDTEEGANNSEERFLMYLIPPDTDISWNKTTTGNKQFMTLVYVDYNIASSTPSGFGIVTSTAMNTNIDTIGYNATTTTLSSGVQFTQAEYSLPFALFAFIFAIIIVLFITFFSYYYIRKSNAD